MPAAPEAAAGVAFAAEAAVGVAFAVMAAGTAAGSGVAGEFEVNPEFDSSGGGPLVFAAAAIFAAATTFAAASAPATW